MTLAQALILSCALATAWLYALLVKAQRERDSLSDALARAQHDADQAAQTRCDMQAAQARARAATASTPAPPQPLAKPAPKPPAPTPQPLPKAAPAPPQPQRPPWGVVAASPFDAPTFDKAAPYKALIAQRDRAFDLYLEISQHIDALERAQIARADALDHHLKTLFAPAAPAPTPDAPDPDPPDPDQDAAPTLLGLDPDTLVAAYLDELHNMIEVSAVNGVISYESFEALRGFCAGHGLRDSQLVRAIRRVGDRLGRHFFVQTVPKDLSPKERGAKFEAFITSTFDPRRFRLLEWRADRRSPHGQLPASSLHPDLEYAFLLRSPPVPFAVECKWRGGFAADDTLTWSRPEQVARYQAFAQDRAVPVFVALGVGGMPQAPQSLYIFPLSALCAPTVNRDQLAPFRRPPDSGRFFDPKGPTLR